MKIKNNKVPDVSALNDAEDLELNTISAYDCTGLIPAEIKNADEALSYEELYPYVTPPSPPKEKNKQ